MVNKGSNSVFGSITAQGGGANSTGGSGSGGSQISAGGTGSGFAGVSGQGNAGGSSTHQPGSFDGGGGGGGATAVGGNARYLRRCTWSARTRGFHRSHLRVPSLIAYFHQMAQQDQRSFRG